MQARKCGLRNNRNPRQFKVYSGFKSLQLQYLRKGSIISERATVLGNTMCSVQIMDKHGRLEKPAAMLINPWHLDIPFVELVS